MMTVVAQTPLVFDDDGGRRVGGRRRVSSSGVRRFVLFSFILYSTVVYLWFADAIVFSRTEAPRGP